MATPTKTVQTQLQAWLEFTAGAAPTFSTPFDCSTILSAAIGIRIARKTSSAFTAGSPNIRIEASIGTTGPWIPIYTYQPAVGASIAATTLNGSVSAAASTFVVTSATNIAAGALVYLGDTSSANWELVRVKGVSGTTITPEEAVVFSHANAAVVSTQAEEIFPTVDLMQYKKIRSVIDDIGSGQNIYAEISLITCDSFG